MFHRLGTFLVARARLILLVSLLGVIVAAVLGVGSFGRLLDEGFDDPSASATKAGALLDQKFGGEPNIIFMVHARSGTVDSPAVTADGQRLTKALMADQRLSGVTSYFGSKAPALRSKDGADALILANVGDADGVLKDYSHVDSAAATLLIGGDKGTDVGGQVGKDLAVAES
ncbi:MAG: rane protein, partial [Mycobacterium sp.]|nr:rane protein [Mycobacterium sp.]